MSVPFVDLKKEIAVCKAEIDKNISEVIDSCSFIGGKTVQSFEVDMAKHQGVNEVAGCGCGTSALGITLKSLGVGPGSEVITTPCTAIPTTEAITYAGAKIVFADIKQGSFNLDPERVAEAITPATKAILPVHLYGIPCEMEAIMQIANEHNLLVLEDCAQAQGAWLNQIRIGNFGDAACFSFFPSKNLGCFGDGGAMISKNEKTVQRFRRLANHGRVSKFEHFEEGTNSRLDAIQAAVLRAKLPLLDKRNALRAQAAEWYREELGDVPGIVLPILPKFAQPVWHIFAIRVKNRLGLQNFLKTKNIYSGLHYAFSLNLQPAYRYLNLGEGSLPEAEAAFREELSLPMFPEITQKQVKKVATAVIEFSRKNLKE